MRRLLLAAAACAAVAIAACDTLPTVPNDASMVVQAYLYAGESVRDVRVTASLPLGDTTASAPPINDANVVLARRGVSYRLSLSDGDSGYYEYKGTDLVVAAGDTWDLDVTYQGVTATARTVVPAATHGVLVSRDTVMVPAIGAGMIVSGTRPDLSTATSVVRWQNATRELYFVTVESTDSGATAIGGQLRGSRRFIFAPAAVDSFMVNALSLTYYGRHRVRVYHVNTEYAGLYESRQQDTRDLNEPATNMRNALGVFTAFASASAEFVAVASP